MTVSPTEVRPATAEDQPAWDAFLQANHGTMFNSWAWGELIAGATGEATARYIAEESGEMVGVAMCLRRTRLGKRWGLNPLLTPYQGILTKETERVKYQAQRHEGRRRRFALIEAMQRDFALLHLQMMGWDMRDFQDRGFRVEPRYTYCVDLAQGWDRLWVELEGSTRRQVNKARKNEAVVLDERVTVEEAHRVTRATFAKNDGEESPVTEAMLRAILESAEFAERRQVLAAREKESGRLLGLVVAIWDEGKTHAHYVHAATDPDELHSGVSSYLVWETIKRLSIDGVKVFDFCGANIPGIARFKEGFAPRLVTYYDVQWSNPPWLAPLRHWYRNRGRELPKL